MRAFLAAVVLLFCISKLNLLMFSMFYSLQGNQCLFIVVRRFLKYVHPFLGYVVEK